MILPVLHLEGRLFSGLAVFIMVHISVNTRLTVQILYCINRLVTFAWKWRYISQANTEHVQGAAKK